MKTTGIYSKKLYRCTSCGHEYLIGTNHWGECYPRCKNCGWKRPMEMGQAHVCLDPIPEGYGLPEPWKLVRLGDSVSMKVEHYDSVEEAKAAGEKWVLEG